MVLTNWILRRRGVDVPINSFKFEKHFVLHPNRQVKVNRFVPLKSSTDLTFYIFFFVSSILKIYAKDKGKNNPPYELVSETIKTWGVGTYAYTQLINHLNQEKASLLEKMEHYERELNINVNKTNGTHRKSKQNGFDHSLDSSGDFYEKNIEFIYEKNIRP